MKHLIEILTRKLLPPSPDPKRPAPSILEQTRWEADFYPFPPRFKVQYFNPGLVDWKGTRFLVARRRKFMVHPGRNDIVLWRLNGNTPIYEYPIKFYNARAEEHWEDPRAIIFNERLFVSYSNFFTRGSQVHQAIAAVNPRMQAEVFHPVYGMNGRTIKANTGHEKNWLWFEHGGELHFIYSTQPHVTVRTKAAMPQFAYETAGFDWSYGLPRGGSPPVYVEEDNLFWSFFHSSLDIHPKHPPRRRYYMGAYAFEPWPPFRPVVATRRPLLTGSEKDRREPSAPLCVFPCGALLDDGTWTVTLGVNDCSCAWIKIPHEDLRRTVSKL